MVVDEQFEKIRRRFADASLRKLPSGAYLVTVPGVTLSPGWSQPVTTVRFIVPLGYPQAKPDCFWADGNLRLQGGNPPQASNQNLIPEANETGLWFSWHASSWNPNSDNLLTYLHVIRKRLGEVR